METAKANRCPNEIPFPFEPYKVQSDLMNIIFQTLEDGNIGIFESPTGTGKSLSVICSSLKWLKDRFLKDNKEKTLETEEISLQPQSGIPDWLASYTSSKALGLEEQARKSQRELETQLSARLENVRQGLEASTKGRAYLSSGFSRKRKAAGEVRLEAGEKSLPEHTSNNPVEEDHFLEEYHSDETQHGTTNSASSSDEEADSDKKRNPFEQEELGPEVRKIFYCSRTHSQTAQFIHEVGRTVFANTRVVALGSRRLLCINPEVKTQPSDAQVNEKCQDLLDSKRKAAKKASKAAKAIEQPPEKKKSQKEKKDTSGCPFLQQHNMDSFVDQVLAMPRDIEELVNLGENASTCAYYGSRKAISLAQLVVMPYSMLLSRDTRESMGLTLKGNIVIIDEAHNLVEAINGANTAKVSLTELRRANAQLCDYQTTYATRLKGKNLAYVNQILYVLRCLVNFLEAGVSNMPSTQDSSSARGAVNSSEMLSINEFVFKAKIDNSNMFKIEKFMKISKISKKMGRFILRDSQIALPSAESKADEETATPFVSRHVSALSIVQSFLAALNHANTDGRILASYASSQELNAVRRGDNEPFLKFVMLNPAVHFQDIALQAHSVVLIGGTMKPMEFMKAQLFSEETLGKKVVTFSCGHVIPPENLLTVCVPRGPTGQEFNFTFQRRGEQAQTDELGRLLTNVVSQVPGGIVCFLPSYSFEEQLLAQWRSNGLLERLNKKKSVFREPRLARDVEQVLSRYSTCARAGGALLFCVVGAKMSEGINFCDELARCVIMVGLPFADLKDPELGQKMAYFDSMASKSGFTGKDYYYQICMRAVNQSIGRSIRHVNDFSTILLVDQRYNDTKIRNLLPDWISAKAQTTLHFGALVALIRNFFKEKHLVHKMLNNIVDITPQI